jgi:hypothetical protein
MITKENSSENSMAAISAVGAMAAVAFRKALDDVAT